MAKTVGKRKGGILKSEHFLGNPEYLGNFPLSFGKSLPSSSSPEQHVVLCPFVQPPSQSAKKSSVSSCVHTWVGVAPKRATDPMSTHSSAAAALSWGVSGMHLVDWFPPTQKSIRNDRVALQLGVHLVLCTLLFPSFFLSVCSRS